MAGAPIHTVQYSIEGARDVLVVRCILTKFEFIVGRWCRNVFCDIVFPRSPDSVCSTSNIEQLILPNLKPQHHRSWQPRFLMLGVNCARADHPKESQLLNNEISRGQVPIAPIAEAIRTNTMTNNHCDQAIPWHHPCMLHPRRPSH